MDRLVSRVMEVARVTMTKLPNQPTLATTQPKRRYIITPKMVRIEGVKTPPNVPKPDVESSSGGGFELEDCCQGKRTRSTTGLSCTCYLKAISPIRSRCNSYHSDGLSPKIPHCFHNCFRRFPQVIPSFPQAIAPVGDGWVPLGISPAPPRETQIPGAYVTLSYKNKAQTLILSWHCGLEKSEVHVSQH